MFAKRKYIALWFWSFSVFIFLNGGNLFGSGNFQNQGPENLVNCLPNYGFFHSTHSCTVFFASDNETVLAGNNEDWSDSNSCFWIIPSINGKHGWIKFGFSGGFPQGGMNEQGLFWDATGCAYLGMPVSEATKTELKVPIMQKVIEECASINEAQQIFEDYFGEDQYKAQYLIGDASGGSMIVEGDDIIPKKEFYQVVTNFYQSHPELGGYPCERYDKAISMLENSTDFSVLSFGQILSETHQEGKYPTQYSNIYDLKRGKVYLFYNHHFDEYIPIDLKDELAKGYRMYYIGGLFSEITPELPKRDGVIDGTKVKFTWRGKRNSQYQLLYSSDATFAEYNNLPVIKQHSKLFDRGFAGILLLGVITVGGVLRRNRKKFAFLSILMGILFFTILCHLDEHVNPTDDPIDDFQMIVDNLKPNTTYYWKIVAQTKGNHDFKSESVVRSFYTGP